MAPLRGKMHIMLFFNNTSKVKEGPLNLSCELIPGQTTDLSVSLLMIGWSGPSMLFYPERYDWFYLYSLIGSDQCSQLMRLGLQDCPRKAAHSVSSLSFLTLLLVLCILPTFLSLWRLGPPWKKWSVGEGENYFAEIAYCLALNWQSAMSNGRASLSREVNLSL